MLSPARPVPELVTSFLDQCRRLGIKGTHQRREIFKELAQTAAHPDAKTIYQGVKQRIPAISFDTVYRTLRLFEEKGVIARVGLPSESARFDANTARHGHFVCSQCGFIGDFRCEALESLILPDEASRFGSLHSINMEVIGICQNCQRLP